jgi:hypothetical protein
VIAMIAPSADNVYVFIAHQTMVAPTLDKVAAWGEDRITSDNYRFAYEPLPLVEININGDAALLRPYRFQTPGTPVFGPQQMSCYDVYLLHEDDAYVVQMCSNQKHYSPQLKAVFEDMTESISFD